MSYDVSMLSIDQLFALLNESVPGHHFDETNIEIDTPIAATGADPQRNTEVIVRGIPGMGFKGQQTVFYDRIDLAEFGELDHGNILQIPDGFTIEGILDAFNELYGSNLTMDDIRDDHVMPDEPQTSGEGVDFQLIANADSYAYRGSVMLSLQLPDVDLEVAIAEQYLDGLVLNLPDAGNPDAP